MVGPDHRGHERPGLLTGFPDGSFRPKQTVTRAQMTVPARQARAGFRGACVAAGAAGALQARGRIAPRAFCINPACLSKIYYTPRFRALLRLRARTAQSGSEANVLFGYLKKLLRLLKIKRQAPPEDGAEAQPPPERLSHKLSRNLEAVKTAFGGSSDVIFRNFPWAGTTASARRSYSSTG